MKSATTLMDLNYNYSAAAGASGVGTSAGNSGQLMAITSTPASTINGQPRNQAFTYDDLGRVVTATDGLRGRGDLHLIDGGIALACGTLLQEAIKSRLLRCKCREARQRIDSPA